MDRLILLRRRELSDQVSVGAEGIDPRLTQLRLVGLRLEIGSDDVFAIPLRDPRCPADERGMALSAERMKGLAHLHRGLCVCLDRGRGDVLPAD